MSTECRKRLQWLAVLPMSEGMITPRELLDLAISRHRQPWNFTVQAAGLPFLILALLLHSGLFASMALILFGAGFLSLPMPAMPPGRWRRTVDRWIGAEVNWLNTPMTGKKLLGFFVFLLVAGFSIWALWTNELVSLTFLAGMLAVYRAYLYNKTTGIDA